MFNKSQARLDAARLQQMIEANALQKANATFDEFSFQRERNERSGQYQLQGFAGENESLAVFGEMNGGTKAG